MSAATEGVARFCSLEFLRFLPLPREPLLVWGDHLDGKRNLAIDYVRTVLTDNDLYFIFFWFCHLISHLNFFHSGFRVVDPHDDVHATFSTRSKELVLP